MLIHNLCLITQVKNKQGGVSHCVLTIYMKKYLKAKEELWKLKIFHHAKNIIFKKYPLKKNPKILPKDHKLYNWSQVSTQAKT